MLGSEQAYGSVMADPGPMQAAMKHLGMLYMSLQTLPHTPGQQQQSFIAPATKPLYQNEDGGPKIDGFLGYSEDILTILRQVNSTTTPSGSEADMILGKVQGMMLRDSLTPPGVSISSTLSDDSSRDFALCHEAFQLATLILIYRRLYKLPSGSQPIRDAVDRIQRTIDSMTQGQPCHAWVAMSMPLFTIGCEALDEEQRNWVRKGVDQLQVCIGSSHVGLLRQALVDIWRLRDARGDGDGVLCAEDLLRKSTFSSHRHNTLTSSMQRSCSTALYYSEQNSVQIYDSTISFWMCYSSSLSISPTWASEPFLTMMLMTS